jgi:DNA recombination protein RmuC
MEVSIIIGVVIVGFIVLAWWLQQVVQRQSSSEQHTKELESMVQRVFGMAVPQITAHSKQVLAGERETIKTDLDNKQQAFERLVKQFQDEMRVRQDEMRILEKDRATQFTALTTSLGEHRKLTDELKISTKQLASVLSNNQERGGWGERIIEDLLLANGLLEGVHYVRQTKLANTTLRPDITLLLPDKKVVPVDVKFPYSEIQKMAAAEGKADKEAHLKQFGQDLKAKVKKVAEYIDPSYDTLDYAIMFVPNEMVFSFINQKFPDIVDEALASRVIMVSPFTFLVVARTVLESYRNFMIGDKLKEVIKYLDEFAKEWLKFRDAFEKYGRSLGTLQKDYEELTGTRFRQMDKKIGQIQQYQQSATLTATTTIETGALQDET